ncbi:helix-turn-helix domain-containing protein [Streptomyces sp. SAS_270]|uniref:helix-turn-helix domain-containing protein n=1 Tax=Streptomyces sp. SAS_270 TaxID=3412748 RepID=UPI00403C2538
MTVVADPSFDPDLDLDVASSADEAVRAWQMAENAFAAVALRPTGRHGLRAAVRTRALGDLVIADWRTPDFEGVRTREMADAEADSVILVTVSEGRQIIETSHDALVLRPGSLALINTGRPGRVVVPGTLVKRAIRIPMTALAPFDTGHGSPQSVVFEARDNALSTLLHDYTAGIDQYLGGMSPLEIETARNALLVLVTGLLRSAQPPPLNKTSGLSFLRTRIEASIIERLPQGAISVSELAATHNVAVRTVQRAFAESGETVRSVARRHRLAATRSALVNTSLPIARIALRWGFCDASHFSRQFRREFSMSPGDYRDAYAVTELTPGA